jgi:glycosyltransferase involved in cell wall biosynthesis
MRIGIDARELCGHVTGVGRYLSGLLREWSRDEGPPHDFVLYAPGPLAVPLDAGRFRVRIVQGRPGTWWEQVRLPPFAASDHLDVFFAPAYTAPLRLRVPTVVVIHDLSYDAHPEWFSLREGARRRFVTRAAAHGAKAIVTVSRFSANEIVDRLGIPVERVHIIPQGIDAPATSTTPAGDPTILYVGSIFNRRHLPDLIAAFAALADRRPAVRLEIVGADRTHPHEDLDRAIRAHGLNGRASYRRYVPDDELRALYGRARAFAFLSEYEGLGMTPLEALAVGIPPVVVDTPVSRETLDSAALFVPSGDVGATSRALELATFDEPTRRRILDAAPAALGRYDWKRSAKETLTLLERAAGSGRWGVRGGAGR